MAKGVPLDAAVIPYYCNSTIYIKSVDSFIDYMQKRVSSGKSRKSVTEVWADKITNVRIKNPFLKLIYKIFKKYIFISLED